MEAKILELLNNHSALPVLFIGSGISRRYLDLPDWEGLLKQFCIVHPYEYYYDKANRKCRENPEMIMPTVADFIEEDFNERWYTSEEYEDSRTAHREEMEQKVSPLKICIAEFFRDRSTQIVDKYQEEIELLSKIGNKNISCIITTNYDCFLEQCFGEFQFHVYVGQDDLLFSTTFEVGEIYKIHGCCKNASTVVINADDYNRVAKKKAYLSAKILTMFLERPVIFLGYSINDADITSILDSIADCLENDQLDLLSKRLLFVEWNRKEGSLDGISLRHITTNSGKTISMQNLLLHNYAPLYRAIMQNQAKYDVKVLRRIKSQLYELVKQNKPTEKLYISTDIDDEDQNVDFVVGVGVYRKFGVVGYRGLKAEELFLYALGRSELTYDETMILKQAVPALYRSRSYLPVCQFIAHTTDRDCINEKVIQSVKKTYYDFRSRGEKQTARDKPAFNMDCSIKEYYKMHGLGKTISKIPLLSPEKINIDDLLDFINLALDETPALLAVDGRGHQSRSQFKKCICIWDWLKYGNEAKATITELTS